MSTAGGPTQESGNRFALRYFILCDDVRQEVTKKITLVGVYTDVVILPTETTQFPKLSFVFSFVRLADEAPRTGTFRLEGPAGTVLPETTFSIEQASPESTTTNMMINASGVTLGVGKHRAVFRVNDSIEFTGEFTVRHNPEAFAAIVA